MPSADRTPTETTDVVIIGAGLAGLTAARDILASGLSCIILEARDRVGGKTWSLPLPDGNGTVDLGAAWINDVNQTQVSFSLNYHFSNPIYGAVASNTFESMAGKMMDAFEKRDRVAARRRRGAASHSMAPTYGTPVLMPRTKKNV